MSVSIIGGNPVPKNLLYLVSIFILDNPYTNDLILFSIEGFLDPPPRISSKKCNVEHFLLRRGGEGVKNVLED